ncbi:MAG: hypothetical protein DI566_13055 [Microbacterium sp.]|nr:MAG: hypothetical protein DI566_13055 [Microbacterium sp.]
MILSTLLAGAALIASPAAHAAAEVQLDNVYLSSDTFADGSRQSLYVDWSVPFGATNPVTLSLDLPEGMRGFADTFPMVGPDGSEAGTCTVTTSAVECTVDPAFVDRNPYGVSGSFWFDVQTELKNQETEQHTFDFGGFSQTVTVDPNPAWCTTNCEYTGQGQGKWGSYNNADDTIIWTVQLPAGEQGIDPGLAITVTDVLNTDDFELIVDGTYPRVLEGTSLAYNSWDREVVSYAVKPTDQITWSTDNLTASFTSVPGAGQDADLGEGRRGTDGSFYQVQWKVRVLDEGKARTYTNGASFTIEGQAGGNTNGGATRYSGGATVVGANFGRFQVTKVRTGTAILNPAFTINYQAYDGDELIDEGSFDIKSGQSYISNEYFKGTRIVLSEIQPTAPSNVDWATPVFLGPDGEPLTELTFSAENGNLGQISEIQLVNQGDLQTNHFTARKVIENPDGVPLPEGADSYRLAWAHDANPAAGVPAFRGGSWFLPVDGTPADSEELPAGIEYYFAEATPPVVPGATWADPVIEINGQEIEPNNEPVVLPADGSIELVVTNRITQNLGGFSITKAISGNGVPLVPDGAEFEVSYSYTAVNGFPAGDGIVTVQAGDTSPVVDDIPAGATVTLTEVRPVTVEGATWGEPQFDLAEFTVETDQIVQVALDNPVTWNDGNFSIRKTIDGTGASLVPSDVAFTVDYTYEIPADLDITPTTGSGTLVVHNDGRAVTSEALPYGTEVTLTEAEPAALHGGTWAGSAFNTRTFTIGDESTHEVVLTNTFTANASTAGLPPTGMEPWVFLLIPAALVLLATGAVIVLANRRRAQAAA